MKQPSGPVRKPAEAAAAVWDCPGLVSLAHFAWTAFVIPGRPIERVVEQETVASEMK